jgi:hypothetical protein
MDLINREIYGNYFYYVALSFLQRKIENDYSSKNLGRGKRLPTQALSLLC